MPLPGILTADVTADIVYNTLQWPVSPNGPAINCGSGRLHSILFLGGFTSVEVMFDVTPDGDNWYPLYDANGEYKLAAAVVANGRSVVVDAMTFYGHRMIRPRLALAQVADRSIIVGLYPR